MNERITTPLPWVVLAVGIFATAGVSAGGRFTERELGQRLAKPRGWRSALVLLKKHPASVYANEARQLLQEHKTNLEYKYRNKLDAVLREAGKALEQELPHLRRAASDDTKGKKAARKRSDAAQKLLELGNDDDTAALAVMPAELFAPMAAVPGLYEKKTTVGARSRAKVDQTRKLYTFSTYKWEPLELGHTRLLKELFGDGQGEIPTGSYHFVDGSYSYRNMPQHSLDGALAHLESLGKERDAKSLVEAARLLRVELKPLLAAKGSAPLPIDKQERVLQAFASVVGAVGLKHRDANDIAKRFIRELRASKGQITESFINAMQRAGDNLNLGDWLGSLTLFHLQLEHGSRFQWERRSKGKGNRVDQFVDRVYDGMVQQPGGRGAYELREGVSQEDARATLDFARVLRSVDLIRDDFIQQLNGLLDKSKGVFNAEIVDTMRVRADAWRRVIDASRETPMAASFERYFRRHDITPVMLAAVRDVNNARKAVADKAGDSAKKSLATKVEVLLMQEANANEIAAELSALSQRVTNYFRDKGWNLNATIPETVLEP